MGYVAVTAGEELVERAADLFEKQRLDGETDPMRVDALDEQLGRLTGQATSEGGLYAPRLAALAVKQAQGDTVEAAFLLRAYRSTLERWDDSEVADPSEMFTVRRVSPAYKDVPGGQVLGPTKDYTRRLLDFALTDDADPPDPTDDWDPDRESPEQLTNVTTLLREEGLLPAADGHETDGSETDEPTDTTRESVTHPVPRDAVLQELARGETGAITALGYSALRGYGQVHPTLAEVRVGRLPVRIEHPYTGDSVRVTSVEVSECEAVVPVFAKRDDPQFAFGYGLTFGRNERKAIGASVLDASIQLDGASDPAEDPEFVLDVVDGMDAFGFVEHLKLPHYVTFQSILDRIRSIRERKRGTADEADTTDADATDGADEAAADGADEADAERTTAGEADAREVTDSE
jgi:alpha-D-ribose 1-methylphosphonate 5-triphosphate synthase subunit PhnI